MIAADVFVTALRRAGVRLCSGTPCSSLAPLINRVTDDAEMEYVAAANEGEAVAIACGAELGGRPAAALFQNSGLGNAVSPLTSLTATFRIPILVITSWRGQPGRPADEPQHELMGAVTPSLLTLLGIPWAQIPADEAALTALLDHATAHMASARTPFGLIVPEGVVGPYRLRSRPDPRTVSCTRVPPRPSAPRHGQDEVLRAIREAGATDVLVTTTGYSGRALYALGDRPNQFYMVGSMGCASSVGLGLARARPDRRVVVIDGDGAVLMRMGALATLGHERPANLVHIVLDNGVHDSTGGQATASASADLAAVAAACGYPRVMRVGDLEELRAALRTPERGLTFIHVRTRPREDRKLPRPVVSPAEVAERLRIWLRESA